MRTKILFLFIIILNANNNLCQNVPDTINITSSLTGTYDTIARKVVRLLPGFSYAASAGNSFTASVNPRILNEPSGDLTGDPGGTIGELVGNNGVVGAIPGRFSVSPSGAATYTIPIDCPSGINGMTPSVSLNYNSQSENGIAGWGWNIAGLSSIKREGKIVSYDSEAEGIQWDETDNFALDGMRLLIKNKYPSNSTQLDADSIGYNKESESTTKIMGYNFGISGPESFKVLTGNGNVLEFNQKQILDSSYADISYYSVSYYPNSYSLDSAGSVSNSKILGWYLSSITDNFGNKIVYNYDNDFVTGRQNLNLTAYYNINDTEFEMPLSVNELIVGESYLKNVSTNDFFTLKNFRLKEILYAGNDYKVSFNYLTRSDSISRYISGGTLILNKILSSVTVNYVPGSKTIKNYAFTYSTDLYSRLEKVTLTGTNNEMYNSTAFVWKADNYSYSKSEDPYEFEIPDHYYTRLQEGYCFFGHQYWPGDFNGDGITDFFNIYDYNLDQINKQHWAVFFNPGEASNALPVRAEGEFSGAKKYNIFDHDLDGKDELYFPYDSIADSDPYVRYHGYQYTNNSFSRNPNIDIGIRLYNANYDDVTLVNSDFDGNGKTEYLLLKDDLSYCNSEGFEYGCSEPSLGSSYGYYLSDINGNNKKEIALLKSDHMDFWEYNKESTSFIRILTIYNVIEGDMILFADFNGDGNDDILFYDITQSIWSVLTSNGDNFDSDIVAPDLDEILAAYPRLMTFDVNKDGKADIVALKDESGTKTLKVYISNGYGFEEKLTQGNLTGWNLRYCGNANSNLSPEIFVGKYDPYYLSFTPDSGSNHIKKIFTGLGNEIDISFNNSLSPYRSEGLSSQEGEGAEQDVTKLLTIPVFNKVVSRVVNGKDSIDYSFQDPGIDTTGLGFLGYGKVYKTVYQGGIPSETYEHYSMVIKGNSQKYELLPDTIINITDNDVLSRFNYYYATKTVDGVDYIVADSTVSVDLINEVKVKKTLNSYNNYLMPQVVKTEYFADNTKESETIDSLTYSNNTGGGKWFINQLMLRKSTQKRPGERDYIRKFDYDYYSTTGALNNDYIEKDTPKELKKSYEYDNFGNVTSLITVAPQDTNDSREREQTMSYSSNGRFPESKTDVSGYSEYYTFNVETGLLESKTDINDLTTQYIYDGLGRLKKTIYPDKNEEMASLFWVGENEDSPEDAMYYIYKQVSGNAPLTTFFDKYGKELRTVSLGLTGNKKYSDKQYNSSNRLWKVSMPYLSTGSPLWTTYSYDSYNRIAGEDYPDSRLKTYDYSKREITVGAGTENETQNTTKKFNSLSEIIESTDNGGNSVLTRYFASGLPKEIQTQGQSHKTRFTYDIYGNRDTISDPDAGGIISVYNTYGYLISQTDSIGNTSDYTYDIAGRVLTRSIGNVQTSITYDTEIKGAVSEISDEYNSITNTYDETGRLESTQETLIEQGGNKSMTGSFTYDLYGRLKTRTWSSGYQITNEYNNLGYLIKIKDASYTLWEATAENALGQITGYSQGAYSTTVSYNSYGDLQGVVTSGVRNVSYGFDDFKNLTYRQDNLTNQKEVFSYDSLNRLTGITYYLNNTHQSGGDKSVFYNNLGNITGKTGVASEGDIQYGENNTGPHALTSISGSEGYSPLNQHISYTLFDKVESITDTLTDETIRKLELTYGFDQQRKKSQYTEGSVNVKKYFFGDYEEIDDGTTIKKYHFISSPTGLCAIFVKEGSVSKLYYTFTDHLGSLTEIVDASNSTVTKQSFDAWGKPRDVSDWRNGATYNLFAGRGYTGHEHLEEFDLINMNGRVYDPVLGRFLSPDPFVQMPEFSQSFNRYSYCLNNPLIYTDPSGDSFLAALLLKALYVTVGHYVINWLNNVINEKMTPKEAFQNTPIVAYVEGTIPYKEKKQSSNNSPSGGSGISEKDLQKLGSNENKENYNSVEYTGFYYDNAEEMRNQLHHMSDMQGGVELLLAQDYKGGAYLLPSKVYNGNKWWNNGPDNAYWSNYHLEILNLNLADIKIFGHDHDRNYRFTDPDDYKLYNTWKKSIYIIMPDGRIHFKYYPTGTEYDYLPNY